MTSLAKIVFFFSILGFSLGANANTEGSSTHSSTAEQAGSSEPLTLAKKVALNKEKAEGLNQYRALLKANMKKRLLQRASKK